VFSGKISRPSVFTGETPALGGAARACSLALAVAFEAVGVLAVAAGQHGEGHCNSDSADVDRLVRGGRSILAVLTPAPDGAARAGSVALAVALEAVRVLAVAALGMHNAVPFNDEFLIHSGGMRNGGLGQDFCCGFFCFGADRLSILAGEALAP